MVPYLNKLESPSSKDALCQVWLILVEWFWRRRFFNFVNVVSLFRNYLPLKKNVALHLNKLEFLSPKEFFSLVKNGTMALEKKIFSKYFSYFVIISPWKKGEALHLNKLESPLPKDSLFQVCMSLAKWFGRRRFWKKIVNV